MKLALLKRTTELSGIFAFAIEDGDPVFADHFKQFQLHNVNEPFAVVRKYPEGFLYIRSIGPPQMWQPGIPRQSIAKAAAVWFDSIDEIVGDLAAADEAICIRFTIAKQDIFMSSGMARYNSNWTSLLEGEQVSVFKDLPAGPFPQPNQYPPPPPTSFESRPKRAVINPKNTFFHRISLAAALVCVGLLIWCFQLQRNLSSMKKEIIERSAANDKELREFTSATVDNKVSSLRVELFADIDRRIANMKDSASALKESGAQQNSGDNSSPIIDPSPVRAIKASEQ